MIYAADKGHMHLAHQVEPNYKGHIRSDAILKIAAGLSNPFPLLAFLGFPVPPFIRDALYDQVANN
eukprot:scaffold302603_cov17-Tisochrysis_lutea.AAC.2